MCGFPRDVPRLFSFVFHTRKIPGGQSVGQKGPDPQAAALFWGDHGHIPLTTNTLGDMWRV